MPLSNRDLGFLPGDIHEARPARCSRRSTTWNVIRQQAGESDRSEKITGAAESQKLEITPLAYIRGRSLSRMFFIVDEAQNLDAA
ncbi:MAG: PhoH family protein [Planctomycetaceae bacterium]